MENRLIKPLHEYLTDHAQQNPNKDAIIYYGNHITYEQLEVYSNRLAHFFQKRNISKGDRIALFLQNTPQFIIAYFAAQKIGAIVVPCNPMFKEWELAYQVKDVGAKAIVFTDDLLDIYNNVAEEVAVQEVIVSNYSDFLPNQPYPEFPIDITERKHCYHSLKEIIHDTELTVPNRPAINMLEDVALMVYTSGTTGSPKGAMLTYNNSAFKTSCLINTYSYTNKDVFLSVMPIFHIAGMLVGMLGPISVGGTIVLLTRFDPNAMLQALERYKVTFMYTTPPMNIEMTECDAIKETDFSTLRLNIATSFGIQVTEELSNEWQAFSGVPFFEFAYGMSEGHTGNTMTRPDDIKYGTFGKPNYETEIKIVDLNDKTKEVPTGEEGEIILKSPSVFKGYWNKEEETKKSLIDGWFYTGDIGKYDEDGFLIFVGREKELIKCSGYSVYPEEVEKMLIKHPNVTEAAVIGIEDEKRGETVKAFIVTNDPSLNPEEIIAWSRERMAVYKYPRYVEIIDEIPKATSGKLLRRLLKE